MQHPPFKIGISAQDRFKLRTEAQRIQQIVSDFQTSNISFSDMFTDLSATVATELRTLHCVVQIIKYYFILHQKII